MTRMIKLEAEGDDMNDLEKISLALEISLAAARRWALVPHRP